MVSMVSFVIEIMLYFVFITTGATFLCAPPHPCSSTHNRYTQIEYLFVYAPRVVQYIRIQEFVQVFTFAPVGHY